LKITTETDLHREEPSIIHVSGGLLNEPPILVAVEALTFGHLLPLFIVELLPEAGQIDGRVERTLQQRVQAVLGAKLALLLQIEK
jgi:hypothetical protein